MSEPGPRVVLPCPNCGARIRLEVEKLAREGCEMTTSNDAIDRTPDCLLEAAAAALEAARAELARSLPTADDRTLTYLTARALSLAFSSLVPRSEEGAYR